jgi:hypothetical protein
MVKKIFNLLPSILLLFNFSCNDNPSHPENNPIEPGHRDYTWEIDTLDMPMNNIHSIWGANPDDVWAVGPGGTFNDRLHHYDGESWKVYDKEQIICTGRTIFGFSENNIWMGGGGGWSGRAGTFWHYDGSEWTENYRYEVANSYNVTVKDIWGTNAKNVYACGTISFVNNGIDSWRGFLLHFNGSVWKELVKGKSNSQFLRVREFNHKVFVFSFEPRKDNNDKDTISFYRIQKGSLEKIYSNSENSIGWGNFGIVGNQLLFWIDNEVFAYNEGNLTNIFKVENKNFDYYLFGRNAKDIFINMKDGIAHYNGNNIKYIKKYNNPLLSTTGGLLFKNEYFGGFLSRTNRSNIILHGKINKKE